MSGGANRYAFAPLFALVHARYKSRSGSGEAQ
jgi:hypothetical protein